MINDPRSSRGTVKTVTNWPLWSLFLEEVAGSNSHGSSSTEGERDRFVHIIIFIVIAVIIA